MAVNNKQRGMALLEALPIILIMFVLMGAALGSWGLVHTAILNSVSARHYTFFMLNQRSDLSYLRDFGNEGGYTGLPAVAIHYKKKQVRFFFIRSEKSIMGDERDFATLRFVDFKSPNSTCQQRSNDCLKARHHTDIYKEVPEGARNKKAVDPAWIMVGYGICLTSSCTPVP